MSEPLRSPKLRPWHLDRVAVVYVRQSTPQQVTDHQESTARQYALADRAIALGWKRDRVIVIDDDLGKSGQSIEDRPGFQRLLAEVALDRVGLILGLGGAMVTAQALQGLVFGVQPTNPLLFGSVAFATGCVALLASAAPAWRATRVDPVAVLSDS